MLYTIMMQVAISVYYDYFVILIYAMRCIAEL